MSDIAELLARVQQFSALELPGQPQFMHMGTSYLVNDLCRALEAQANVIAILKNTLDLKLKRIAELEEVYDAGFAEAIEMAAGECDRFVSSYALRDAIKALKRLNRSEGHA